MVYLWIIDSTVYVAGIFCFHIYKKENKDDNTIC